MDYSQMVFNWLLGNPQSIFRHRSLLQTLVAGVISSHGPWPYLLRTITVTILINSYQFPLNPFKTHEFLRISDFLSNVVIHESKLVFPRGTSRRKDRVGASGELQGDLGKNGLCEIMLGLVSITAVWFKNHPYLW